MKTETLNDYIIRDRGAFYNCTSETFHTEGTTFKIRETMNGKNCFFHTRLFSRHFITAGTEMVQALDRLSGGGKKGLELEFLGKALPEFRIEESYPHYVYEEDTLPSLPLPRGYVLKAADPADHPPLQAFLDTCTEEDIEDALIDLEDPDHEIHLVYHGSIPVAYAAYRLWESGLGDVGILVHGDFRRRGLGAAAVAEVTRICLENGHLPFYRTSSENRGSAAIAEKVGYRLQWTTAYCGCGSFDK